MYAYFEFQASRKELKCDPNFRVKADIPEKPKLCVCIYS